MANAIHKFLKSVEDFENLFAIVPAALVGKAKQKRKGRKNEDGKKKIVAEKSEISD